MHLLGVGKEASENSGPWHRVDAGGIQTQECSWRDEMSIHIIRVQAESRLDQWYVAEALSPATPQEVSAVSFNILEDQLSHHEMCNPPHIWEG